MKTILFLKREDLFPNFWIFSKLNKFYYWIFFNFYILLTIKKYKKKDLIIIADYETKIKLEKIGIKSVLLEDYITKKKKIYTASKKLVKKLFKFDKINNILNYDKINLGYIAEESFSFLVSDEILDKIYLIKDILEKEKPKKIVIKNKYNSFDKSCLSVANSYGIKVNYFVPSFYEFIGNIIRKIIKKYSLFVRFYKIPLINRREFVKTNNLEKIKKINNEKPKILFLGFDKTFFGRIENIVKEFRKEDSCYPIIMCTYFDVQKNLKKKGISFVSFGDFMNKKITRKINKKMDTIHNTWKTIRKNKDFRRIFYTEKVDLWPILKEELDDLFFIKFKWMLHYLETSKKLFDELKISCVATICDFIMLSRSIVSFAKDKGIPTLMIQQGIYGTPEGRSLVPLTADKIVVWGENDKKILVKWRVNPKRIIITGSQRYDNFTHKKYDEKEKRDLMRKLGLKKDKKTLILATQALENLDGSFAIKEKKEILEIIIKIIKNSKDKQLILKLHPREDPRLHKSILRKFNAQNVVMIQQEYDIKQLVNISDALITIYSTVCYDSILSGKPVIISNFMGRKEEGISQLIKTGSCVCANNELEFQKILNKIYNKKFMNRFKVGRKKFIKKYLFRMDNKASKRIANVIKDIKI